MDVFDRFPGVQKEEFEFVAISALIFNEIARKLRFGDLIGKFDQN